MWTRQIQQNYINGVANVRGFLQCLSRSRTIPSGRCRQAAGRTHAAGPSQGFYVMRLRRGAPLISALIYQLCPMVLPQPTAVDGPRPMEWCRPVGGSLKYGTLNDGKPAPIDRVWTARSLRPVSLAEYAFRIGPLRRWARTNPAMPFRAGRLDRTARSMSPPCHHCSEAEAGRPTRAWLLAARARHTSRQGRLTRLRGSTPSFARAMPILAAACAIWRSAAHENPEAIAGEEMPRS
jgi:hypothetical protein